jgi:hypothetical protein
MFLYACTVKIIQLLRRNTYKLINQKNLTVMRCLWHRQFDRLNADVNQDPEIGSKTLSCGTASSTAAYRLHPGTFIPWNNGAKFSPWKNMTTFLLLEKAISENNFQKIFSPIS